MISTTPFPTLTAEEAALEIKNGHTVAFSGFTPAGGAKAVPRAIAEKAKAEHADGKDFRIRVLTGASTGAQLDDALAEASAISWRAPYQSSRTLRKQTNTNEVQFVDMHLSHLPQTVSEGFFGEIDVAVIEATEISGDGRVYLTSSIGASPTYLACAKKIIIELNRYHSPRVSEMADVRILPPPPHRSPIPIFNALQKIGWPFATVDPKKVIGIVENNEPDGIGGFSPADETSKRIANNVVEFLLQERAAGRIPKEFLPLQSGVGNIANAVMDGLGENDDIPPFVMYSEVFQDALIELMENDKLLGASTTSLTLSKEKLEHVYENIDFYKDRVVLRPQELSNNPGIIRRLGVISTNTALEVDVYGNVNSTHVCGMQMMNGIGGSADFTRNAYISVFMCPSIAKGGKISTVVPMTPHIDHNEHSVQVIVTEQGVADLRGLAPMERAKAIIENCAHPAYREYLAKYVESGPSGHIRHNLDTCYDMHRNLMQHGAMVPELDLTSLA